jgi:alkylhydroperoxidase family enzyme
MVLADFEASPVFSDLEKQVLRYATALTKTPVVVPDAVFEPLKQSFSERQIVELTSAIAWENYRARFNHALGIESEGFSRGACCVLPEQPDA